MPDYESSSLWDPETEYMVRLEGLPLRPETKAALEAWSATLWDFLGREREGPGGISISNVSDEELEAHEREGQRLWHLVRDELGDDFEVGYGVLGPDPDDPYGAIKRIVWDPSAIE